jgi:hypothetical protein
MVLWFTIIKTKNQERILGMIGVARFTVDRF